MLSADSVRGLPLLWIGAALGCAVEGAPVPPAVTDRSDHYVSVSFADGYYAMSCGGDDVRGYVETDEGTWREIETRPSGPAFVDGKWSGPSMCCLVGCYPIETRTVDVWEYVPMGQYPIPDGTATGRKQHMEQYRTMVQGARDAWEQSDPAQRMDWTEFAQKLMTASGIDFDTASAYTAPAYERVRPAGRMRAQFAVFTDERCTVSDTVDVVFRP